MPFVQSFFIGGTAAEATGFAARRWTKLSSPTISLIKAAVIATVGGLCCLLTVDPLGGSLVVWRLVMYLLEAFRFWIPGDCGGFILQLLANCRANPHVA